VEESSSATFLQIDLQSLFGSGRSRKMDFDKVWDHFNSRETEFLTGALIYSIKSHDFDSSRFETKLRSIGFDLKVKSLPRPIKRKYNDYSSTVHVSHVIPLTIDCISRLDRFDKWILFSNNGEFVDLCKHLKGLGKKIELWSFSENYDPILEPYADRMHFIDENFCLQKPSISVFGANWGLEKFDSMFDSTSTKRY
jgi:uncharacterized LabA/DUF88 family protein